MAAPKKFLTDKFEKFAGREVKVTEKKIKVDLGDYEIDAVEYKVSNRDPVIKELKAEAKKAGFALRVWLPNTVGTADVRMNRLNVKISKADEGAYKIDRVYRG